MNTIYPAPESRMATLLKDKMDFQKTHALLHVVVRRHAYLRDKAESMGISHSEDWEYVQLENMLEDMGLEYTIHGAGSTGNIEFTNKPTCGAPKLKI